MKRAVLLAAVAVGAVLLLRERTTAAAPGQQIVTPGGLGSIYRAPGDDGLGGLDALFKDLSPAAMTQSDALAGTGSALSSAARGAARLGKLLEGGSSSLSAPAAALSGIGNTAPGAVMSASSLAAAPAFSFPSTLGGGAAVPALGVPEVGAVVGGAPAAGAGAGAGVVSATALSAGIFAGAAAPFVVNKLFGSGKSPELQGARERLTRAAIAGDTLTINGRRVVPDVTRQAFTGEGYHVRGSRDLTVQPGSDGQFHLVKLWGADSTSARNTEAMLVQAGVPLARASTLAHLRPEYARRVAGLTSNDGA